MDSDNNNNWFTGTGAPGGTPGARASAPSSGNRPGQKKRASKGRGKPKRSGSAALAIVVAVIAVVIAAGAVGVFCLHTYSGEPQWVYIPRGSSADAIGDSIESSLGSGERNRVMLFWRLLNAEPAKAAGAYLVSPGESELNIARRLRSGAQTPVKVRFNNVRTMAELAEKVSAPLEYSAADFLAAADSSLTAAGFSDSRTFPAAFLPDTYEAYWNESPERTIRTLLGYRNSFWNDERRAKAKALGLTPVQAATLASIVEEESAQRVEHGKIARLYLNRLKTGMKLQADPTAKFAYGDFTLRRITRAVIDTPSPYNTYYVNGLPPGPIRIPAAATIDAVLNAPQHDALFMCARTDGSGQHDFERDYNRHRENARRYHAWLNSRGIGTTKK